MHKIASLKSSSREISIVTELSQAMNHQQICGQHWRYPTTQDMNLCSQHDAGKEVVEYFRQKSTHEQLDGNLHLDEYQSYEKKIVQK